jgi:aminoglycoside N3'-acetyltransferase
VAGLKALLPGSIRRPLARIKGVLRALIRTLDRRTLSKDEFAAFLRDFGFKPGAVVMLHSSMDEIVRRVPSLKPMQLVPFFKELVGEEGTLLMPTFPFERLQADYLERNEVFRPAKTPSRVGFLTEIFRRGKDVKRSLHPTHSVAAWGQHAEELTQDHHKGTAFGKNSPFWLMREYDGVVTTVGVGPITISHFHVPEELHERTRSHHYETETRRASIEIDGTAIEYELHALRRDTVRDSRPAIRILRRAGILRLESRSGLLLSAADVGAFIDRQMEEIGKGTIGI